MKKRIFEADGIVRDKGIAIIDGKISSDDSRVEVICDKYQNAQGDVIYKSHNGAYFVFVVHEMDESSNPLSFISDSKVIKWGWIVPMLPINYYE